MFAYDLVTLGDNSIYYKCFFHPRRADPFLGITKLDYQLLQYSSLAGWPIAYYRLVRLNLHDVICLWDANCRCGPERRLDFHEFPAHRANLCGYFLNVRVRYYYLYPLVFIFMGFNHSLYYWESWGHAVTLILFFTALGRLRKHVPLQTKTGTSRTLFSHLCWFWGRSLVVHEA